MPFADDSFDLILNIESSHLYRDCQQFFEECTRVLRENGFLCWADLRYTNQVSSHSFTTNCSFKISYFQFKATMNQAQKSGLQLITIEDITEQVLQGIESTTAKYDSMFQNAPKIIRFFQNSIRTTYCAPGTKSYKRLLKREKIYVCACWQNCRRITLD